MTDLRKAAEMALGALETIRGEKHIESAHIIAKNARYLLREALAQPEQEPWDTTDMAHRTGGLTIDDDDIQQYKRPWVGLTDEEIENLDLPDKPTVKEFVRFIEAALRRMNT